MSIAEEYDSIIQNFQTKVEHSPLRQDSSEYQTLLTSFIEKLLNLKNTVYNKLSLFSENETLDDISTGSLKFLSIDYYLAMMCSRKQVTAKQVDDPVARNKLKLKFLEKSVQLFMQYLASLNNSEILDPLLSKKLDSFHNSYKPTLKDLYAQPSGKDDLSAAQLKRQQKIDMYRAAKSVEEGLKRLETRAKRRQDEDNSYEDEDECLRELYVQKLRSLAYNAFENVEKILYETELLENFTKNPQELQSTKANIEELKNRSDPTGYTEKLESLNVPLISKEGKVLRNFTLVDKKSQLRSKVRGYGQYGPTMSVEEFLEKEWESGRVLQGGKDSQQHESGADEDNEKWQDMETYKAREWDEFKEANPRGSGNTLNRG